MAAHHSIQEQRRDHHVGGHSDTVCSSEPARRPEAEDEADRSDHEKPVDARHVYLTELPGRGVVDLLSREETELNGLGGERVGPRDEGLRCDDRGQCGEHHQRKHRPIRSQQVEGVLYRIRLVDQQGSLSHVIEHESGEDEADPTEPDRTLAEVPDVRIQGLAPGDDEKHATKGEEGKERLLDDQRHSPARVDRSKDTRLLQDLEKPEQPENTEPEHHYRTEEVSQGRRPLVLDHEQPYEDDCRYDQNP